MQSQTAVAFFGKEAVCHVPGNEGGGLEVRGNSEVTRFFGAGFKPTSRPAAGAPDAAAYVVFYVVTRFVVQKGSVVVVVRKQIVRLTQHSIISVGLAASLI